MFIYSRCGITISLVYIDDILLTSNPAPPLATLIHCLNKVFSLKDLGPFLLFYLH